MNNTKRSKNDKCIRFENGKFYFTKELERKLFFFLTLFMLVAGAMAKAGLF